ncbi:amidohydrolase family protein [Haloechinothrix sp. LS1_15]|uniref:amidohydrolase family protein n=1 Tax=Haloechinothrix sp. LS1_15 TaxID=2652248 RepID=UPI0029477ADC|nr:amidohydrolase family protein [Haloechinothrix sp. LS1_15]MDV6014562.1 imidazolonepropionase [Haloechinothrix sp. LS1_15]
MTALLITGIGELTTNEPALGTLSDAAVVLDGQRVAWVGAAAEAPPADARFDAGGRAVLPGWVDAHTHLVFAGDRTAEFTARMAGEPYSAGGIAVTVAATRSASDAGLASNLARLAHEARMQGTTYLETKTGYGLTVADEARSARIAASVADEVTFLGAHIVPEGVSGEEYVIEVTGPMLDAVSGHVQWVDVFCERGAFGEQDAETVLLAAAERGLGTRVHGNQLGHGPGIQLAVRHGAASVDHCCYATDADTEALASSWRDGRAGTVATVLPACDLSTKGPLAPARRLWDAGAVVALATNANPGSSYTTSMAFCVATAVLQLGLSVEEAVWAATRGGAKALRADTGDGAVGVLRPGARADVHVLDAPSITHLAYRPGVPLTWAVWRSGERVR